MKAFGVQCLTILELKIGSGMWKQLDPLLSSSALLSVSEYLSLFNEFNALESA